MSDEGRPAGTGRLITGLAWAVLLAGLWIWGRAITDVPRSGPEPPGGDVPAAGRPLIPLPPAREPLPAARPRRVDIPSIGVQAPVVPRGLDRDGAVAPPPYDQPGAVGWYGSGAQPGVAGAALFVAHVDTDSKPAVFYGLSSARPGEKIRVVRADHTVAEFTIEDVQAVSRDRFDAHQAYGPREQGRAELRLITCGGTYDRVAKAYTANVVVSAYLTGWDSASRS
ncbi:class F sortase [Streptomyces sp. A3M-1-3]|uniref:class F sortase n=1 Tax=Streptomyces sp. A3M-1-3 TaxID=2962044 RepID=UPI0020B7AB92|nr:class F sortase [Streptomyces sp. A3M-1-3]MCP3819516.1 class F sortase [Streptomyces sp. A3M-1-3]